MINYTAIRGKVYQRIAEWREAGKWIHPDADLGREGKRAYYLPNFYCQRHLSNLLGSEWLDVMTDEQTAACEALVGENGYVVYRLLLVKRGLADGS